MTAVKRRQPSADAEVFSVIPRREPFAHRAVAGKPQPGEMTNSSARHGDRVGGHRNRSANEVRVARAAPATFDRPQHVAISSSKQGAERRGSLPSRVARKPGEESSPKNVAAGRSAAKRFLKHPSFSTLRKSHKYGSIMEG